MPDMNPAIDFVTAARPLIRVFSAGITACIIGVNAIAKFALTAFKELENCSSALAVSINPSFRARKAAYSPAITKTRLKVFFRVVPNLLTGLITLSADFPMPDILLPSDENAFAPTLLILPNTLPNPEPSFFSTVLDRVCISDHLAFRPSNFFCVDKIRCSTAASCDVVLSDGSAAESSCHFFCSIAIC